MPQDLSGSQVGMTPANSINNPRPDSRRGRNEFPQTYLFLSTDRYGEYSPFYWAKCERGDIINLHSVHDLHTFTMKSPMVSNVQMTKSYIKVPMQAIYPRNWDRMFTIPTQGDDVPADTRALLDVKTLIDVIVRMFNDGSSDDLPLIQLRAALLLSQIASHGSLLARFNQHLNVVLSFNGQLISVDKFLDSYYFPKLFDLIRDNSIYLGNGQNNINLAVDGVNDPYAVSERRFLELLISGEYDLSDFENYSTNFTDQISVAYQYNSIGSSDDPYRSFINIEALISYQLACAQFGTNDHVDFIYSAALFRENMEALYLTGNRRTPVFTYNGITMLYDVFSCKVLSEMIQRLDGQDVSAYDFFMNLFQYQNSLRYGDYFTGSKPRPLAVGEYSASVNNNEVSAIDITRSIQMQRLLNRVNMVGRKLGDYLSGIFGGSIPAAPKDVPIFLAHQKFTIDGFETNNTGESQLDADVQNITTMNLRTVKDKFAFEIEIDEPCYIIGMNSYESMRIYSRTMDRFSFHHDRYDDFIPEMQYIGDQDIQRVELDSHSSYGLPFAYALRYMEYKQRYSYASGGFIENLPSWAFITDNSDGNPPANNIDPNYIRSSPSEFDRFYKSLNGFSRGSYFHFIVAHTNITSPYRMMEYTPEILK